MPTADAPDNRFSHLAPDGEVRMVDVSDKGVTARAARASATLHARPSLLDAVFAGRLPKGDALATARVAGIMAAKRTAEWIPLCHPLVLDWACIDFERSADDTLVVHCSVRTRASTGVEMEAMVGASAAALTVYDMAKAADRALVIGPVQLESKSGGASGDFRRDPVPSD